MTRSGPRSDANAAVVLALLVGIVYVSSLPTWVLIVVVVVIGAVRIGPRLAGAAAKDRARNEPPPPDSLPLGVGADARVALSFRQLAAHGLIVGASGSGKTTSLLTLLCGAVERGLPVVAIDLKGSRTFADALTAQCECSGRSFQGWSLNGPGHWNPLQYGDASELKDKLIASERFSEPHYQRAAERYLQLAIQVLQQARSDKPVTLAAVTNLLDPDHLRRLLPHIPQDFALHVSDYLNTLNRDQRSAVLGVQSRLAIVAESGPGEFLQPAARERTIDLCRALCGGSEVVLFSLNSSRNPKLCAQIAAMVIQDVIAIAGYRQNMPNRPLALIAIDEFSSLDHDNLLAVVAKAREAGISVLLSTQELADLERLAEGFQDQVLGNTGFLLAHRQNVPDSAELIARVIGTHTVYHHTQQVRESTGFEKLVTGHRGLWGTGMGTRREVEEFVVHPNIIKQLPTGRAVLITKTPWSTHQLVNVQPWSLRGENGNAN